MTGVSAGVSASAVVVGPVKAIASPWPTERRSTWAAALWVIDRRVVRLPKSSNSSNLIASTIPPAAFGAANPSATDALRRSTTSRSGLGSYEV